MQSFFAGTITLIVAGLLSRIFGAIPKFVLPRLVGMEALGLYQMTYPLLIFVITLARFGLPVALTKRIAEASRQGDTGTIRRLFLLGLLLAIISGAILSLVIFLSAPLIARYYLHHPEATLTIQMVGVSILPISIASTFRAYYQGLSEMRPPALSSVMETIMRTVTTLVLARLLAPLGMGKAAAGMMLAISIGEWFGLLWLIYPLWKDNRNQKIPLAQPLIPPPTSQPKHDRTSLFSLFPSLWRMAYPVGLTGIVGTLAYALEPSLVVWCFETTGMHKSDVLSAYGALNGLAMFLIWFPTTFTYPLAVSLIPAVSRASVVHDQKLIIRRLNQSLRFIAAISMPLVAFMIIFRKPLALVLFGEKSVADYLLWIAPFAPLLYVQGPLGAALQGMSLQRITFFHTLVGSTGRLLAIALFVPLTTLGMNGVALAVDISIVLTTFLHIDRLKRVLKWRIPWEGQLLSLMSALVAALLIYVLFPLGESPQGVGLIVDFSLMLLLTALIYRFSGLITARDMRRIIQTFRRR
ncbi:MAG: Stage V sporulation protein B [Candidatus Carbobacillus altaicus]|uniref:Stage V sporulation protein B n=1 Tax=Candidatus Carbonibacillus altaicus TaxID=2163959 RepID=A0A2R6Y5B6_9BACL|nr:MAG: Stage V sporulation protein B [Candidatus Carbobacillus altaicus]